MTDSRFEGDRSSLTEILMRTTEAINAEQAKTPDQDAKQDEAVGPFDDYGLRCAEYVRSVGQQAVNKADEFNKRCEAFATNMLAEFGKLSQAANETMKRTESAMDTIQTLADTFRKKENGQ